jgi:hypothetical protein
MKKIIITILAIVTIAYNTKAQDREQFAFGLKIGTNYSNVYDAKGQDFDANAKFGLATGAFFSFPIGRYLGFQPEVLFSQKGFKGTGTMLGSTYDVTRTTSYLDVPLFIALKPTEMFTVVLGPQFSYLMKQKDVFSNSASSFQQEKEFQNDNVRKNIVSFTGGFDINMEHVVLSARAGWDLSHNNGDGTSTTPRYKNVWLQTTIGYRFYN